MTNHIEISGAVLKGLAKLAPTDDLCYYLCGINVELARDHVILVATDGHAIAAYRQQFAQPYEGEAMSFIVPIGMLKPLKPKGVVKLTIGETAQTIEASDGKQVVVRKITLMQGQLEWLGTTVGHRYPDWRRALGAVPNGEPADVNPYYVARIAACLDILTGAPSDGADYHVHLGGADGNVWITCKDPGFLGVIGPRSASAESRSDVPLNHWGRAAAAEALFAADIGDDE